MKACWLVLVVVFASRDVLADARADVEKLVRKEPFGSYVAKPVIYVDGVAVAKGDERFKMTGATVYARPEFNLKVTRLDVVADDARGVAWFHGAGTLVETRNNIVAEFRLNGVAVKEGGWKVAAIGVTRIDDDKDLLAAAKTSKAKPAPAAPTLTGDKKLAQAAAGWFASFAKAAGTGKRIASGTAPNEYRTDAATGALVAGWDKLKLGAFKIDATTFAGGSLGFVRASARWPVGKGIVPLVLTAIAVPDGASWRWVSLAWTQHFVLSDSDLDD